MAELTNKSWNLVRGLRAAALIGFGSALLQAGCLWIFTLARWQLTHVSALDRRDDSALILMYMMSAGIGCSLVCASTAFATWAPDGQFRLARSLAIIFVLSITFWFELGSLTPARTKSASPSLVYPFVFIISPILAGIILTATRVIENRSDSSAEDVDVESREEA